ncbi:sugar ABC transporter substrate-binding protein [Kitasatospora sp. NPDC006697]|uniref:sugar ABC transporter substrate-binding protein n=1 Tax=Kitasatospora sp. NPDC006697 TaxID=3364020 RepID=UPI0036CD32E2
MRPTTGPATAIGGSILLLTGTLAGCAPDSSSPSQPAAPLAGIGIDIPRTDTAFWQAYAKFLRQDITAGHLDVLPITQSDGDDGRFAANVRSLAAQRPSAVVLAPQNTTTTETVLDELLAKRIHAISVDTVPESGEVYMVVRADNRAMGTSACEYLGKQLGGKGKVADLQGAQDSINGYDRSTAFAHCLHTEFPGIQLYQLPTDWKPDVAAAKLGDALAATPDLNAVYLESGGAFLQPVLNLFQQKGVLKPAGQAGHITVVADDGTPAELDAIRKGSIDATISQPADQYAKYALAYAQAAAAGTVLKPGPTDHGSTVIALPNGLEDQLPSPLVTKANVDDPGLWANQLTG